MSTTAGRRAGVDRALVAITGLVLLGAGVVCVLLFAGIADRDDRPLLNRSTDRWFARNDWFWWAVAGAAVLVVFLGALWIARRLVRVRPPMHLVRPMPGGSLRIDRDAVGDAVRHELTAVPGVLVATGTVVDDPDRGRPCLVVVCEVDEAADVPTVDDAVRGERLAALRTFLSDPELPLDVTYRLVPADAARVR